jgi:DNA-binding NtrC family response regulator
MMKTILIVDPEISGTSAADALDRHGFATLRASEAQTALTIIRSGMPVDLVITELQLPDMDGLDFLSSLRRGGSGLPVLVVTSRGSIESYLHAINLGVVEYLNKPVLTKDLSHIIRNVLDHQRHPCATLDAA